MRNQRKATMMIAGFLATACTVAGVTQLSAAVVNAEDVTIATTSMVTAGANTTLGVDNWKAYFDYQTSYYLAAYCPPGAGSVRTKMIDLSAFTKEDDLFRWTSYGDIDTYTVKLIDVTDESNYLSVSFVPNEYMKYNSACLGSSSSWTYKTTSGEYVTTDGHYEWGAIMGYWGDLSNEFNNNGGVGLDMNGDGTYNWISWGSTAENGVDRDIVEFSLAYEDGNFYTPRKKWTNVDFQDWVGFAGTQIYAEFSWTTAKNGHGVALHTIAGIDTSATTSTVKTMVKAPILADGKKGEEFAIPQASAYAYTHSVGTTVSVFYKDGSTWTDKTALVSNGKFTPDAAGEWKIVYTADDGSGVTAESALKVEGPVIKVETVETASLVTAGANTTLLPAAHWESYFDYQKTDYFAAYSNVAGAGSVRTKMIDLSVFTKADELFRWTSYGDIDTYTVKLIDVTDESNYISLSFIPNEYMKYNSACLGSTSKWTYKTTSGEYVTTDGHYEWGAIMGYWGDLSNEFNNNGGVGLDMNGDGTYNWIGWGSTAENGVDRDIVEFSLAYEDGNFYTPRKKWTNVDFQDWVGFAGTQVYAEFSWTTAKNGHGVAFTKIAGIDTLATTATVETVVKAPSVADAFQGKEMVIPQASAYAYTHSVAATSEVFYKDGGSWVDKTALMLDGKFTPDAVGEWKIVYAADDGSGVTAESKFAVVEEPTLDLAKLLAVKAQVNTNNQDNLQIRFLATVDVLDYAVAGFEITVGDKTITVTCKNVYTSVLASGNEIDAKGVSGDSFANYIFMYTVSGVPTVDTEFTVRAFVETFDGEVIYGAARTVAIADYNN